MCTHAFCTIFCIGACASCSICSVMAIHTSLFSAGSCFRTLILDALHFWPMHLPDSFSDSSETERIAHTAQAVQHLLCLIRHECSTLWAHTFSDGATPDRAIVFQWAFVCLSLWPSYWTASSHGTRCEMAGEIFPTSAPTAKTWHQPYVHRSVHIRCNFKPTSTCPTPPNPMSNVACTSNATSNQRQHAPPHPTLYPP